MLAAFTPNHAITHVMGFSKTILIHGWLHNVGANCRSVCSKLQNYLACKTYLNKVFNWNFNTNLVSAEFLC